MSLVGADVAAIRNFVLGLNKRSAQIAQATAAMTAVVEGLPWAGTDRERFLTEWRSTHQPGLLALIADLGQAARDAGRAADEQERASSVKADGS